MVGVEPEAVACRDLLLKDLERLELELDHLSAPRAEQVVVVVAAEGGLVAASLPRNDGRLENSRLREERQRPVDGRLRASDPPRLQIADEILDRIVTLARQRRLHDRGPRLGQAEIPLVEEPLESIECLLRPCVQSQTLRATWSHNHATLAAQRRRCQRWFFCPATEILGPAQVVPRTDISSPSCPTFLAELRTFVTYRRGLLLLLALFALPAPSRAGAEADLPKALRTLFDGSPLAAARTGIFVSTVDTGEVIFAHDPDTLLNPASNVKLLTSAAALARLGPEFRFSTELLADAWPLKGEVRTLFVRGKGDPSMVTERLWAVAGDLVHLGVRRISDLVLDDGYFDGDRLGPGYDQEDGDRAYLSPAGALSLDFNAVAVHVAPGERKGGLSRVELDPASAFLSLDNRTVTVERGGLDRVLVSTHLEGQREKVVVEGRIALGSRPRVVYRRIDDPTLFFGYTFKTLLEQRGVKVGRVLTGLAPEGARLLMVSQSDSLAEIVRRLNKTSNNFTAEQLLKTLGAEEKGVPGSWPKGVLAEEEFLQELSIPRGSYVLRNGSGLNDANRFSARQMVTLLRAMWARFPLSPEYVVSLPVAGRDGTIRWRMDGTEAAGRLRAKTGTLDGVVSLSGYVQEASGRVLAFAILVNDSPGRAGVVRTVDALGAALASGGAPPAESSAVPTSFRAEDPAERLKTYYALGRSGDVRNEPLLRHTLQAETDPLSRLALSECVYLADPDSDTARRGMVETLAADPSESATAVGAVAGRDAPRAFPGCRGRRGRARAAPPTPRARREGPPRWPPGDGHRGCARRRGDHGPRGLLVRLLGRPAIPRPRRPFGGFRPASPGPKTTAAPSTPPCAPSRRAATSSRSSRRSSPGSSIRRGAEEGSRGRPGSRSHQISQRSLPLRTMALVSLQEKACRNSLRLDKGPFTRKRGGECGLVAASILATSGRETVHQPWANPRKKAWSGVKPDTFASGAFPAREAS